MSIVNLVWSIALAAVGIIGIWLAGNKSWTGWALGLGAQALWVVFALVTTQYGFILSALAYGFVYGRNLYRWRKTRTVKVKVVADPSKYLEALRGIR